MLGFYYIVAMDVTFVCGKTWTTDAFYRETRNNMENRKKDGCNTVEMECASIMAASRFRGIDLYQYLYAEDNLDSDLWDSRTMGKVPKSAYEQYLRIALEIASRVQNKKSVAKQKQRIQTYSKR